MTPAKDTIPEGSRLVVWTPIRPQLLVNKGRYVVVYDYELTMMMIKQWRADGMSREDCLELIFWDSKPIPPRKEVKHEPQSPTTPGRFQSKW